MPKKKKSEAGQLFLQLPEKPAEQVSDLFPISSGEVLLVDGLNVMNGFKSGSRNPCLDFLLLLLLEIKRASGDFECIFDANTFHLLGTKDREAYKNIIAKHRKRFIESTGGLRADDLLLQRADKYHRRIITNDRYNGYADRFSWLKTEADKRLIKFVRVGDDLQIPALNILTRCRRGTTALIKELEVFLN